jgi:hypothetical protein
VRREADLPIAQRALFHLEDKNEETCTFDDDHCGDLVTAYAIDSADNASQASYETFFKARLNTTEYNPGEPAQQP